jgi:hypothetical protein
VNKKRSSATANLVNATIVAATFAGTVLAIYVVTVSIDT